MPGMTTETPPTETAPANPAPAAPTPPAGARRAPDPAPRRGGGGLAFAILLALAAAGAAGYTAWTVWTMRQDLGAANGLKGQVDTLQTAVDGLRDDNANLRRRVSDADGVNRSAREEVLGMAVYMGGGPALMYAADAIAAFEQYDELADTEAVVD